MQQHSRKQSLTNRKALHELSKSYELMEVIGRGVEGSVLRAAEIKTGKNVAIKHIKLDQMHPYIIKKLIREVQIQRELSLGPAAEFIPKMVSVVTDDLLQESLEHREMFIVMEYVDGMTLKQFIDKAQSREIELTSSMCTTIVFNLLRAVAAVHKSNVIHRDIKPANILIKKDLNVKLCDFGLARTCPSGSDFRIEVPHTKDARKDLAKSLYESRHERRQKPRQVSPHVVSRIYRAPEVALLHPTYSFPIDVWAVGCIIAELLQCVSEYHELSAEDEYARYLFKAISCDPLSPSGSVEEMENDLLKVILRILGRQGTADVQFLNRKGVMKIVKKIGEENPKIKFADEFPESCKGLAKVLQGCLMFNPHFRYSAEMLLDQPVFSDLRMLSCP